nr:retrovirus-related Pol polyprotein from transposon TNT 1-94 [Tanacetum cinerariifolium]
MWLYNYKQTSSEKKVKPRIKNSSIRTRYQDKDEDPSSRLDQGTKIRKSSKDAESSKDSRSKEKNSPINSKDASQYQYKSSGYRQAALSKEVDSESGKFYWWKTLRGRPTAAGKDHMICCSHISALTLEDVMATLNSKEIKERSKAKGDDGEGLYVKGRTDRGIHVSQGESQDQSLEGKVKAINGSRVVLSGIRTHNYVYSLDGHTMACEFNASVKEKDSLAQLCVESGIARHLTVFRMLQQNRLAERMNRTLMDKRLNNHKLKEDQTDQEDSDDEDAGDQEIDQLPDLTDYQLEEDTHESLTYQEVVACEDSFKWKAIMKEEVDSLRKNKTWDGFKRSSYDSCVYYKSYEPGEYIYLLLYIDDMLIACKSKAEIGSIKSLLIKEFDMKELKEAKKILGMEIVRDRNLKILRVSQSGYVSKILNNFRIDNEKSVKMPLGRHFNLSLKDCPVRDCDVKRMSKVPYANAIGSLMYLMVCMRPDIAYAVSVVSRYLENPGKNHWETVKWILKYLRGNANIGLVYGTDRGNHMDVTGFIDSDYATDLDKGRSITEVLEAKTDKVLKVGTEHNVADALTMVVPGLRLQNSLEFLNVGVG